MTPRAVCFDATGTLIEPAEGVGEVYRRLALEHGVDLPAWRLEDAFARVMRHAPARGVLGESIEARSQNEIDWWFERIRQTFQATDSSARFDDFSAFATALFDFYRRPAAWRTRPGVVALLDSLRDQDCRLGVVSNFDHRLPKILEALDLAKYFSLIITTVTLGIAKPDRALFERVCERFDCPIEQLVYVGDDAPEILEAIAALGLRVFDIRASDGLPDLASRTATLWPTLETRVDGARKPD